MRKGFYPFSQQPQFVQTVKKVDKRLDGDLDFDGLVGASIARPYPMAVGPFRRRALLAPTISIRMGGGAKRVLQQPLSYLFQQVLGGGGQAVGHGGGRRGVGAGGGNVGFNLGLGARGANH